MIWKIIGRALRKDGKRVKPSFCAFNISRQSFINLGVKVADSTFPRLRGLLGKMRLRSDEALWVVPSRGIHTIGVMFPIDVIYLDARLHVIGVLEGLGPLRIAPIRWQCASVLELPAGTIGGSGTKVGDQLLICSPEAMELYWESQRQEVQQSEMPQELREEEDSPPSALRRAV